MEAKRIRVEYNEEKADFWIDTEEEKASESSMTIERCESKTPILKKAQDIIRKRFIEPAKRTIYIQYKPV